MSEVFIKITDEGGLKDEPTTILYKGKVRVKDYAATVSI